LSHYTFGAILLSFIIFAIGCGSEHSYLQQVVRRASPVVFNPHLGRGGLNMIAVPLVANDQMIIGQVWVWLDRERLYVEHRTQADWQIERTHVALGESPGDIASSSLGCLAFGGFPWAAALDPPVDRHTTTISLAAAGLDDADEIVISAHAEISGTRQGAWADGPSLPACPGLAKYFRVDLRELRGLILWNKLGTVAEVTESEIGPDGVIVGDISLWQARHGDGFRPDPRERNHNIPDNYVEFAGLQLGPRGSIEFWYQPDWDDATIDHAVDILSYGIPDDVYNTHLAVTFNDWQNRLNSGAFDRSTTASVFVQQFAPIPNWSRTEPIHLAITWDGSAPAAADRLKVFINGDALPNTSYFGDPQLSDWRRDAVLRLGSRLVSGDWQRHNWEGLDGVIDNIKIWNYPKVDFTDRFIE
jgi:hypothetical protein